MSAGVFFYTEHSLLHAAWIVAFIHARAHAQCTLLSTGLFIPNKIQTGAQTCCRTI